MAGETPTDELRPYEHLLLRLTSLREQEESLGKDVDQALDRFKGWIPEPGSKVDEFDEELAELYHGNVPMEEEIHWLELAHRERYGPQETP